MAYEEDFLSILGRTVDFVRSERNAAREMAEIEQLALVRQWIRSRGVDPGPAECITDSLDEFLENWADMGGKSISDTRG